MTGYVLWPERIPQNAVYRTSKLGRWWIQNGPYGIAAALMGRRIRCAWPVSRDECPVAVARRCERKLP